jgi:hypothetical protein
MSNDLKLPMTGRRVWNTAGMSYQNNDWVYWYSTPSGIYGWGIGIGNTYIAWSVYRRAQAQSIRCFKN